MTARAGSPSVSPVDAGVHAVDATFEGVPLTVYVLEGRRLALVDAGVAMTPEQHLEPAIARLRAGAGDVEWIVNTHAHHDHMGGNAAVRERNPGVRVAMHRRDAGWAESPERYLAGMYRAAFPGVWDPPAEFEERLLGLCGAGAAVDVPLEDGDALDVGGRCLRVRWTPAHSPGHVVFHDEQAEITFAGDAIQRHGTEIAGRPWLFPNYADLDAYLGSLELLRSLPARLTCTAHFGVLDRERLEVLLHESEAMVQTIDELLLELLHRHEAIALTDVVDDVLERWPRYERGLQAHLTPAVHLDRMVREGVAVPSIEGGIKRWALAERGDPVAGFDPEAPGQAQADV